MSILAVQSAQDAHEAISTQKTSKPVAEPVSGRSVGAYNVNISDEGRVMAEEAKKELMYLPEAYHDLLPDTFQILEIGAPTMVHKLSAEEIKDQNEYVHMLSKFFREERNDKGVQSTEDYLNQTRNNDKLKDEIYHAVRECLAADSRAMELMEYFGVPL